MRTLLHCIRRTKLRFLPRAQFSTQSTGAFRGGEEYDVIIVGGGMVGAAVGCGLASKSLTRSLRVAIIDSNSLDGLLTKTPKGVIPDSRVSAITPTTAAFLQDVGAWKHIEGCRYAPFDSMQVWDYTGRGYTRYSAADVGKSVLGFVVENRVIVSALVSHLQESQFASLLCPARVKTIMLPQHLSHSDVRENIADSTNGLAKVELEDGRCLHTRLVVGADGARSKIRTLAGVQSFKRDYEQQAVVCTIETTRKHSTAWQRFLPTGPLAILPMGDTLSNVVWTTSPERALELKNMREEDFVACINQALVEDFGPFPSSTVSGLFGDRLESLLGGLPPSCSESFEPPPRITKCLSERLSFPLFLGHAYKYVAPHLALVGDAAHTVHPLAGQGVNLGFGDAAALTNTVATGVELGRDLGEVSLLKQYEKERMSANIPMMALLDGFQRAFSTDLAPVNVARAAAFAAVQLIGPLKRKVVSYAMGELELLK